MRAHLRGHRLAGQGLAHFASELGQQVLAGVGDVHHLVLSGSRRGRGTASAPLRLCASAPLHLPWRPPPRALFTRSQLPLPRGSPRKLEEKAAQASHWRHISALVDAAEWHADLGARTPDQ